MATGFASWAGEPAVGQAISFEQSRDNGHAETAGGGAGADPAPVSRSAQSGAGLLTAALVYGLGLGGLFALAFAFAYGRVVARAGPRATAYGLAAAAFVAVYLVPFVKYPANPPAVGHPDTLGRRTALYAVMVAISLLAAVAALRLRPALARALGEHGATLLAALAYLVIVVAAGLALPGVQEVPADFPASTLWRFREASVGMQAVLWATIGLVFAATAQRAMSGRTILPRRSRAGRPAAPSGAPDRRDRAA